MTNTKINQIITEEIAAAKLPEDVSFDIRFSRNSAFIMATERHLWRMNYNVTRNGVTTTELDEHYEYSTIGFGVRVWGIQGEQIVRAKVREYIARAARVAS